MVGILEGILLGILQGITEWLPISSSGHLALAQHYFGVAAPVSFDIFLHVGTLIAVCAYFRDDIAGFAGKTGLWINVLIALVPTAIIGFAFKDFFESMFSSPTYIAGALAITGIWLLITRNANGKGHVDGARAFIIGIAQGIAVAPGISRSGATIGAGMLMGIERTEAARFSFIAAIPAVIGAGAYEAIAGARGAVGAGAYEAVAGLGVLGANGAGAYGAVGETLILDAGTVAGVVVAAIVGYLTIGLLMRVVERGKFWWFGVYCLALAGIVFII
ncbi:MAG: undecaprenyl-diphosphate phosphatase [Candidatus Micrarchaeota archaeon]|nr:undecaprenyl-diphosphate phosphatase [Candidatus Micrarchaeota archaeon]